MEIDIHVDCVEAVDVDVENDDAVVDDCIVEKQMKKKKKIDLMMDVDELFDDAIVVIGCDDC